VHAGNDTLKEVKVLQSFSSIIYSYLFLFYNFLLCPDMY